MAHVMPSPKENQTYVPIAGLMDNAVANKAQENQGKDQDVVRLLNVICVLYVCIVLALVLVVVVQLCK